MLDVTAERFSLDRLKTPIGVALLATDEAGRLCALDCRSGFGAAVIHARRCAC